MGIGSEWPGVVQNYLERAHLLKQRRLTVVSSIAAPPPLLYPLTQNITYQIEFSNKCQFGKNYAILFQNHYTHEIIIFELFRGLQLQLSGVFRIN